jgi:hypothetical protein
MKTIIIDCGGDSVLEDALVMRLVQHLQDTGYGVDHTNYYNNAVTMISTIAKEIADAPTDPVVAVEPAVTMDIPMAPDAVGAVELPTVELPPEAPPAPMDIPVVAPAAPFSRDALLMNLSTVTAVPTTFDPACPVSTLYAKNINCDGEYVSFEYCGTWVKYPVESSATVLPCCNVGPEFTPTSIRVAVKFVGSEAMYSCLLCVAECAGDTGCCVKFGADLADVVNHESPSTAP